MNNYLEKRKGYYSAENRMQMLTDFDPAAYLCKSQMVIGSLQI